jgi:hypothetical protein
LIFTKTIRSEERGRSGFFLLKQQHRATPRNTAQHRATPRNTAQHRATPRNTAQHRAMQRNTTLHTKAWWTRRTCSPLKFILFYS